MRSVTAITTGKLNCRVLMIFDYINYCKNYEAIKIQL